MDRNLLEKIAKEVEKENSIFAQKSHLNTLAFPSKIVGREDKTKELVKILLGYKQGLVVPFVSVFGRSGCGKSTVVRFVCENLQGIQYCFVNLHRAKTIFGCINLILGELGVANITNAQGLNTGFEVIKDAIASKSSKDGLFVLALNEFDTIFSDKRGKPSDFVYKIVTMVENLKSEGYHACVIGISNSVVSEYNLDDRVKSRIGGSEIFFESYSSSAILEILKQRAKKAFSIKIDPKIIKHCYA